MRLLHKIGGKRAVKMTVHGGAQRLKIDGLDGGNNFAATVATFLLRP